MKSPDAPHVELGFYFADLTGDKSLELMFEFLTTDGGGFTGTLNVHPGLGHGDPFGSIYDHPFAERIVKSIGAVKLLMTSAIDRIIQIGLRNTTGIVDGTPEVLTQLSIDQRSITTDHHPIAIWVDGTAFSFPDGNIPANAKRVGKAVYAAFRRLILGVNPSYATITVDYGLECPTDLVYNPQTHAFTDFYVSRDFIGQSGLSTIKRKSDGAFHESLPHGLITCCSPIVSLESVVPRESAYLLSESVGKLISSIAKYRSNGD